jgi:hypothetical protein
MICLSVLQFTVLSLVILPLLPDRDHGPYGALNPYQIWWMVVLISGVSLAGFAALRLTGQRHGAVALGVLGGLVSAPRPRSPSVGMPGPETRWHSSTSSPWPYCPISPSSWRWRSYLVAGVMARHAIAGMGAIAIGLIAAWAVLRVL